MALLILTRPLQFTSYFACEITIDDERAARFGTRRTLAVELPPGRHRIVARLGRMHSDVAHFEAGPDSELRFQVRTKFNAWHAAISFAPAIWIIGASVFTLGNPNFALVIFLPSALLGIVAALHGVYLSCRGGPWLSLTPLRASTPLVGQKEIPAGSLLKYADLPAPTLVKPVRLRFRLRGIMIAVAIVAVVLWLAVGGFRTFRQAQYQNNAKLHAANEAVWRENERRQNEIAHRLDDLKLNSGSIRGSAVRSAARADYHQVMRRKYERAAALGLLSVEPDPPEPPSP